MAQLAQPADAGNLSEAEQAFVDSLPAGDGLPETAPSEEANTPADSPAADSTEAAPVSDEGTPDPLAVPDTFTPQDVRGMLEGITDPQARAAAEAAVKNFQADYTRSKQQLAEAARGLGDLDPEKARTAVEFYDSLQSDPDFALEVHGYLSRAFEAMGMTPGQAAEAASEEVASASTPAQQPSDVDFDDPDAELQAKLRQMEQRLDTWEQQAQERELARREEELAAELLRQEMALRQSDPGLKDEHLDMIYDLATTTGANLQEAYDRFKGFRESLLTEYIEQKTSVPETVSDPAPAAAQAPPDVPRLADGSPDLEAVHRIAMQRLVNTMAGRE